MDNIFQIGVFLYKKISDKYASVIGYISDSEDTDREYAVVPEIVEDLEVVEIGCREKGPESDCIHHLILSKNIRRIDPKACIFGTSGHWIYSIEVSPENPYLEIFDGVLYKKGRQIALLNVSNVDREEYIMPPETIEIANDAFAGVKLKKLSISPNCKKIGARAFATAPLDNINIPSSVKMIGDEAFGVNNFLSKVTIFLEGETELGENVAEKIVISEKNRMYTISENLLMTVDGKRILKYVGDRNNNEVKIPNNVEQIDANAFKRADCITKIKFNNNLKYIGSKAFVDTKIKTVKLPSNIEFFAPDAFEFPKVKVLLTKDCKHYRNDDVAIYHLNEDGSESIVSIIDKTINEFIVPNSVKKLEKRIFDGCKNLSSLILPEGLVKFDDSCIYQSNKPDRYIKKIELPASLESLIIKGKYCNVIGLTKYSVSENNKHYFIDDAVLYEVNSDNDFTAIIGQNNKCRRLEIIDGTTAIADYAFSPINFPGYTYLTDICFPQSLKLIGEHSFSGTSIKELIIPKGVKTILNCAFSECNKLEKVYISESVEGIAYNAFSDCCNLKEITVDSSNRFFSSIDGVLYNKDCSKMIFFPEGKKKN